MKLSFTILQASFVAVCGICGKKSKSQPWWSETIGYDEEVPEPELPEDWTLLDNNVVCPNHTIKLDDKEWK
jgi:hypothetical protein